jgi:hypothetical protein
MSQTFRHFTAFGKRIESYLIGLVLREGLDVNMPLVNDGAIDGLVKKPDGSFVQNLQVTADKLGYFGYHKKFNVYIELLSFDRLLNSAKERNRVFFDKLGLPVT